MERIRESVHGLWRQVAKAVGQGASFVNPGTATANEYKTMGKQKTNAIYPSDHMAEPFMQAVVAATDELANM